EVHQAASLLAAGMPDAKVGEALKGPPWAAKKVIAKAKKADVATLEQAICVFAALEGELRGGGDVRVDEDAAFSVALARAAGQRPAPGGGAERRSRRARADAVAARS